MNKAEENKTNIVRSELWNNIYEVLARLSTKTTNGDCLDRPSACVEIEALFNQEHQSRVNAITTKVILKHTRENKRKFADKMAELDYGAGMEKTLELLKQ